MADFKYEIIKNCGVLSQTSKGWRKEVNYMSWQGFPPKFDIREWAPDRSKMGKGITLSSEEVKILKEILNSEDLTLEEE